MKLHALTLLLASTLVFGQGLSNVVTYNTPAGPARVIGVDVDKDNVKDSVFVSSAANSVNVELTVASSAGGGSGGTGNPWAPFNVYPAGQSPVAVAAGDWNADSNVDLLVANAGSQDVTVLLGNGIGGFTAASPIALGLTPTAIAVTDVDLDNNLDIVIGHAGGIRVIYGGANPHPAFDLALAAPVAQLAADSSPLVAAATAAGTLSVFIRDGIGGLTPSVNALAVNGGANALYLGDLNNDGKKDIVVDNPASLALLLGDGLGNFSAITPIALPSGFTPAGFDAVDADSNLYPELVVTSTAGQIHVLRGSASGFTPSFTQTLANPTSSIAAGRYNAYTFLLVLHPTVSKGTNALLQLPVPVSVTVQTSPAGLQAVVAGQTVVAPNTSSRNTGTTLSLDVPSPQPAGPGSRLSFLNWSQGGAKSQTVTVPATNAFYTASFQLEHQVTTTITPAGAGSVALWPASPDGFYPVGTTVTVTPTANACYASTGVTPAPSFPVTSPVTVNATFQSTAAVNATAQVVITRSGVVFNAQTGLYQQTIYVRNNGAPLASPVLSLTGVTSGWNWVNYTGLTQCTAPANAKYRLILPSLATGATAQVPITFQRATASSLVYTTRVLAGPGQP